MRPETLGIRHKGKRSRRARITWAHSFFTMADIEGLGFRNTRHESLSDLSFWAGESRAFGAALALRIRSRPVCLVMLRR